MLRANRLTLAALAAAFLAGCSSDRPANADGDQPAPATDARPALTDLVTDIRSGLADIPSRVAADPDAARRVAIELYATRQELIEEHYGEVELEHVTDALAEQVERAEVRFHALLQRLADSPPDTARVRASADSLFAALEDVLAEARQAGVIANGR